MPATLDRLANDALELSPDERLTLAYRLLESADAESSSGAEAAMDLEIQRRVASFRAGEMQTVPAAEVFAELRAIAPD